MSCVSEKAHHECACIPPDMHAHGFFYYDARYNIIIHWQWKRTGGCCYNVGYIDGLVQDCMQYLQRASNEDTAVLH